MVETERPSGDLRGMVSRLIAGPGRAQQLTAPVGPASALRMTTTAPGRHHADSAEAAPPSAPPRFRLRPRWIVAIGIAAVAAVAAPLTLSWTSGEQPSGTMVAPASRGFACRAGGTEHDRAAACLAAAAVRPDDGGNDKGLGDGTGVGIPDVAGRHQQVIPDGRLCSAGRERFRGLDLARADWPATPMVSGGITTLRFRLAGQYSGKLSFYLTLPAFDPTAPLGWANIDQTPIGTASGRPDKDGTYRVQVRMPVRTGRQLLYTIWEQSGGPAALYSCSDVVFGGTAGTAPGALRPAPSPSPAALAAPASSSTEADSLWGSVN